MTESQSSTNKAGAGASMGKSVEKSKSAPSLSYILPLLTDVLFVAWLFTEYAFEHSPASQAVMALFAAAVFVRMLLTQRIFFNGWMPFYALLLLWCVIGAFTYSIDRASSLGIAKTLLINLAFLSFVYQYLMLQKNIERAFTLYMIAAALVSVYFLVRCWPVDVVYGRLGVIQHEGFTEVPINPNWLGMLAAFACCMAAHKWIYGSYNWIFLVALFGGVVLLTKSTKAFAVIGVLFVAMLLFRFPKKWGWKLVGLLGVCALFFQFVLVNIPLLDHVFFQRIRYTLESLRGIRVTSSVTERGGLFAVGWEAFTKHPQTGVGAGCFRLLEGAKETYSHNNYIELLVSGGVPMLLLYYAPQLLAVVRAFRVRRPSRACKLALAMAIIQIVMDFGMVSYTDRTSLLLLLFLLAATRIDVNRNDDGSARRFLSYFQNPYRLVQRASTRGQLKWMNDELYLRLLYRGCTGKTLHLRPPVNMTEKLQWMKLYDRDPFYTTLADKLAVRDVVKDRAGENVLIPLLGVWDKPSQIDFDALPDRFVLKCTHDSGSALLCTDKATFDRQAAMDFLGDRLRVNYYYAGREWPYKNVPPRILAEAFIGGDDGARPVDYKFFCFDSVVRAALVCTDRTEKGAKYYFVGRDFELLPYNDATADAPKDLVLPKPVCFDALLSLAETLGAGLRAVRVDLYEVGGKAYFGEMTLFDQSGFAADYVGDGDRIMGSYLRTEAPV